MSKFSGKCDLYDSLIAIQRYSEDELKNSVKIFIGSSDAPLKIESYKDLIPYYPHIIWLAHYNNDERAAVIRISSESYVDREEREMLEIYKKHLLRIYNRCKRKKAVFDVDAAVNEVAMFGVNKECIKELAVRVKEKGKRATMDGIHRPMQESYRELLVEEMIKYGIDPAKYGYERFMQKTGG